VLNRRNSLALAGFLAKSCETAGESAVGPESKVDHPVVETALHRPLRNGPVTSEVLDLINAGPLFGEPDQRWEQCVTDLRDHAIKLERVPARDHLSDVEAALLDGIWREHGSKDQWQLVDWCHAHCKEWTPVTNGCAPIAVEQIGMALGKTPQQIQRLRQDAVELNRLDEIFTPA
jgi:hypothetical protein